MGNQLSHMVAQSAQQLNRVRSWQKLHSLCSSLVPTSGISRLCTALGLGFGILDVHVPVSSVNYMSVTCRLHVNYIPVTFQLQSMHHLLFFRSRIGVFSFVGCLKSFTTAGSIMWAFWMGEGFPQGCLMWQAKKTTRQVKTQGTQG